MRKYELIVVASKQPVVRHMVFYITAKDKKEASKKATLEKAKLRKFGWKIKESLLEDRTNFR